jgi:hypothetical protein
MHGLVLDTSLREAAALVGLWHEALRKFVNGTTERPHQRSLRAMGHLYLERRRGGVGEVRGVAPAGPLKLLFSRGLDESVAEAKGLFDGWRDGHAPPPLADELERWVVSKLREEYAAEPDWTRRKRSRR